MITGEDTGPTDKLEVLFKATVVTLGCVVNAIVFAQVRVMVKVRVRVRVRVTVRVRVRVRVRRSSSKQQSSR